MTDLESINFIASRGVEVVILGENKVSLNGFYKSDTVTVDLNARTITSRYNEVTYYDDPSQLVEDLISLNEVWHERSRDRFVGWEKMNESWCLVKKDFYEL